MQEQMSIIKFELSIPELKKTLEQFSLDRIRSFEQLAEDVKVGVSSAVSSILNAEIGIFLGEPEQSDNKRNGHSYKNYSLKGLGTLRIKVPRDRKNEFQSKVIPKHERVDPRLKKDLLALHLAGLSTRTLAMISGRLLNMPVSHQTVSSSLNEIAPAAEKWLTRPIEKKYWCLIVDGSYFKLRRLDSVTREPSLVVIGIDETHHKSILAIEPGHRDNSASWRQLFRDLKLRGLDSQSVTLGVMDGLPGLESVFKEEFARSTTARCWFHALQNILAKTPEKYSAGFHMALKKIMYANGYSDAKQRFFELKEGYHKSCERAVHCLEKDLESLLSHYQFDSKLWRALKTTNSIERIHKEFKRRTRPMEALTEANLRTVQAFVALKLEIGWRKRGIDTYDNVGKMIKSKGEKIAYNSAEKIESHVDQALAELTPVN